MDSRLIGITTEDLENELLKRKSVGGRQIARFSVIKEQLYEVLINMFNQGRVGNFIFTDNGAFVQGVTKDFPDKMWIKIEIPLVKEGEEI